MLVFGEKDSLTYKNKIYIALQIASACEYLHSIDIIHRDLKSQNVLIGDSNYHIKLCNLSN